jgi:hypothetical protein
MRNDYEKWSVEFYSDLVSDPWEAWQAATEAAARRCVEICNVAVGTDAYPDLQYGKVLCVAAIAREFGLEDKPRG